MNPEPPIARWLAAMILVIVALAAPSAADAHQGPAHAGHRRTASAEARPVAGTSFDAARARASQVSVAVSVAVGPGAIIRSDGLARQDCRAPHGICGCGAACCASGILTASINLSGPARAHRVLRPDDAAARAGIGPEALTEPPKPLA